MKSPRNLYALTAIALLLAGIAVFTLATRQPRQPLPSPKPAVAVRKDTATAKPKKTAVAMKPAPRPPVVAGDTIIIGEVRDADGKPLPKVVVSDSYTCTLTDTAGRYRLRRHAKARFVWVSIPDYCEVPTHTPTDRTALFYRPLTKDTTGYDFTFRRLPSGKETNYRLIVFGDPQVTNAFSPYYTGPNDNPVKKSDVARFTDETMVDVKRTIAEWPDLTPVYALSMGDDVQYYGGYNASLEREIRTALGSSRAIVFSVIGNHDQDGKDLYKRKWEENFGPTDYSFDRGDVHYVCLNDVQFYRGMAYYSPGELTPPQMHWLYEDLRLADHSKKVIVCYHIPLTFGNGHYSKAVPLNLPSEPGHYASSRLKEILLLTGGFKGGVELFCGHTHFAINHEINFEGRHLLEHCHAAACGNIWQSNINICGTPNGYYVYTVNDTRITDAYYKGTFWPRDRQMTVFRAGTDFNGESYRADWNLKPNALVVNVFNADSRWRVEAVENGVGYPMRRLNHQGQDAFATGYHHKYSQSVSYRFVSKGNGYLIMNHLYTYEPKVPNAVITIRATDPYGRTYTASSNDAVTEPFFNYAHYY